jgi:transcriptional regulator of acetoin/glycerol metabolism
MPLSQQKTLLRVLESKTVTRIGGEQEIPVNVRVICATNKNLRSEVLKSRFREDLYYRLSAINLKIPPLRKRKEDLLALIMALIEDLGDRRFDRSKFYDKQIARLFEYNWPGNVRELRNVIERIIYVPDYEVDEIFEERRALDDPADEPYPLGLNEKKRIIELLSDCNGNVSEVARTMGVSRKTLYQRMKKYNIIRRRM